MLLPDLEVLIHAHRAKSPEHDRYAEWHRRLGSGPEPFGLSELGVSTFVRLVTNPRSGGSPQA